MGIFAGSGVGKSVLMSMLARYTACDVAVIGLVGERGREVQEFIEDDLGPEGLARSVVVVATSDEPPLMRRQAAQLAMTVAKSFRDQGDFGMALATRSPGFGIITGCNLLRTPGACRSRPCSTGPTGIAAISTAC